MQVTLASGQIADLTQFTPLDLHRLQFEQEQAFAQQITAAPKGSAARAETVERSYNTVCTILALLQEEQGPLSMGFDARYVGLVHTLLKSQQRRTGRTPRLFEVGYGSGLLLAKVHELGFPIAGIEVAQSMHAQAVDLLPSACHKELLVGGLLTHERLVAAEQFDVIYWNDVFEHIPPDEIADYLARLHNLLTPGGCLVTITPNWHSRPNDVTGDFCPARTEARGLHLREYTLREVTSLLRAAGFRRVETPLCKTRSRFITGGGGLTALKRLFEPALEWAPARYVGQLTRGLALSCTVAYK